MAEEVGPKEANVEYDIKFEWRARPRSPWDDMVSPPLPMRYDLYFSFTYRAKCEKEDDPQLDAISELEHIAVLGPSEFGGSLYFKSFGDGQRVKRYGDQVDRPVSTQEAWGSGSKHVEIKFVSRTQFFERKDGVTKRVFTKVEEPLGRTIPAPPLDTRPIKPFPTPGDPPKPKAPSSGE